jgi:hypothetical protein
MYADPKHLRDHEIKLRVDEDTFHLIEAMARFSRTQKAVLVRDLVKAALDQMTEEFNKNTDAA